MIFAILLRLCVIIGVMMIFQSLFQILANVDIPLVALLTKSASFVVLAAIGIYFELKLYKGINEKA